MPIQVFGGMQQAGGIKKALAEHRTHNQKQGDELLQLAEGLDHNDPRLPYVHQSFPAMLYKPAPGEAGEKVVMNATEKAIAIEEGWREEPYPRVQIQVLDPATEKAELKRKNDELQSQIIQQAEAINKLNALMADVLAVKKGK